MKYLTRNQLVEIDRRTIEHFGIPALLLMENAGRAVAEECVKLLRRSFAGQTKRRITVICGRGNNGGDGFVCARHLHNRGYAVKIIYLGSLENRHSLTQETETNINIVRRLKIPILEAPWLFSQTQIERRNKLWRILSRLVRDSDIIVDAIFGIGLKREIENPLKTFIEWINSLKKPVVAVDIPSGIDTDSGEVLGTAIKARVTVTFGFPKKGFLNKEARKFLGRVVVDEISLAV